MRQENDDDCAWKQCTLGDVGTLTENADAGLPISDVASPTTFSLLIFFSFSAAAADGLDDESVE